MSIPACIANAIQRKREELEASEPYDASLVCSEKDLSCWERFSTKSVLAFTGNEERIRLLEPEFARVGLTDVNVVWNQPNKFVERLFETETKESFTGRPFKFSIYNNAFGHYSIIKTAYELGHESCLVMEDDIRFLRDTSLIAEIVNDLPGDYECALLDSHPLHEQQLTGEQIGDRVSEYWRACDDRTSAACYALSRTGMATMIDIYESTPFGSSDMNFKSSVFDRIYYADPCVARQTKVDGGATNTSYFSWSKLYDNIGCPRRNYGK